MKQFLLLIFLTIAAPWFSTAARADSGVVKTSMAGRWEGTAEIVVDWCKQRRLPVALEIHPDGSVTGKVGDATLAKGQIMSNRGWIGRKLNLATDYIIRGDLNGDIVAAEGIARPKVSIPLDFTGSGYSGGLHTSGQKLGGVRDGILSASGLKLRRVGANNGLQER